MDKIVQVADHIINTKYDKLPQDVIDKTKIFVLDTLGVALAASDATCVKEVLNLLKSFGDKDEATVFTFGNKLNAMDAALINSMMVHSLDLDDLHEDSIVHPSSCQIPVAFAVAEQLGRPVSGKELIEAIVLGGDISCRFAKSVISGMGFIRSGICGIFGAVATAAKLRGCDRDTIINAMGIALSQCAGNAQVLKDGSLVKRMQPGLMGRDGILSVLLAEAGMQGVQNVLEGQFGFLELYKRGEVAPEKITEDLGKVYEMSNVTIKPYIGGRYIHGPAELGIALAKEYSLTPDMVEALNVYLPQTAYNYVGAPFDLSRGNIQVMVQFNATYACAAGFVRGDLSIDELDEAVIRDPLIGEVIKKVHLFVDETVEDPIATTPVTLEIVTKDGKKYKKSVQYLKGHPNAFMSMDEIIAKYYKSVGYSNYDFSKENINRIKELSLNLEQVADVREIVKLMVRN